MGSVRILGALGVVVVALVVVLAWPKKERVVVPPAEVVVSSYVEPVVVEAEETFTPVSSDAELPPDVDRMTQLFQPYPPVLPIVETVSYTSRVPWLTGRAAYLGDYASHYHTSKHFISRSLKGMGNYLSDTVSKGDRFNVFREDVDLEFHLVLDLSRLKMWVYYYDRGADERVLLKAYPVCVGRLDSSRPSGSLTPTGVFSLGNEIALYREGEMGLYRGEPREMISVFGARWIPLGREVANCTGPCRGTGIHGAPWVKDVDTGEYRERRECIGSYESNGCIRLRTEDIEELFAVIVSKPSFIHIVKDFQEARLPGQEKI